jgi:hypothetical protein
VEIMDTSLGKETYFIELTQDLRKVWPESEPPFRKPDVYVVVASDDLAAVLDGSLSPLQVMHSNIPPTYVWCYRF